MAFIKAIGLSRAAAFDQHTIKLKWYSNRQNKLSISLSSPNPRFVPKMKCGPFARECCNLCPYWRAHCVLLDAGMRVRGGIRQVHSVVMVQARADGSPLLAQHTVCMHVQTGNTGAATVHTHRTYSVQHSTLAIATRNAQQSAAARAHTQQQCPALDRHTAGDS